MLLTVNLKGRHKVDEQLQVICFVNVQAKRNDSVDYVILYILLYCEDPAILL